MKTLKGYKTIILVLLFTIFSIASYTEVVEAGKTHIIIHFKENDNVGRSAYIWAQNEKGFPNQKTFEGIEKKLNYTDSFGKVFDIKLNERYEQIGLLFVKFNGTTPDWNTKELDDRYIELKDGFAEVWVTQNVKDPKNENPDNKAEIYLKTLNQLNQAQVDRIKPLLEKAYKDNDMNKINELTTEASKLNGKMSELKDKVKELEKFITDNPGLDPSNVKSLNDLKNGIDTEDLKLEQVESKIKAIDDKINEIKTKMNIMELKQKAKDKINALQDINQMQKNSLNAKVDTATKNNEIEKIKTNANELDIQMKELKKLNETLTSFITDNNADLNDTDKTTLDNLKNSIDLNANLELDSIKAKINEIKNQLGNINTTLEATKKLKLAKEKAKTEIENINDLNNKQKADLKQKIDAAGSKGNIDLIKTSADELAIEMKKFNEKYTKLDTYIKGTEFNNITEENKTKLKDLKTEVDSKKDSNLNKETVIELTKKIDDILENVKNSPNTLDTAKIDTKNNIKKLDKLNAKQKTKLENEINSANNVNEVNTIKTNANELNTEMKKLDEKYTKLDTYIKGTEFNNLTAENKTKLNELKTEVENKKDIDLDKNAVVDLTKKIDDILENIKVVSPLDIAKQKAKTDIETLKDLNNLQKDDLKTQVTAAVDEKSIARIVNTAKLLDRDMLDLKNKLAEINNYLKQNDNILNDKDKNALKKLIDDSTNKNLDSNKIKSLIQEFNDKLNEFNIAMNKKNNKKIIDNLKNLNSEQKKALKDEITAENDSEKIKEILEKSIELDAEMKKLTDKIKEIDDFKTSPEYDKLEAADKTKIDNLKTELDTEKVKDLKIDKVKELIEKATVELNKAKSMQIKWEDYKKYADAFYYKDNDIVNRINDNFFININGSKELVGNNGLNFIAGLQIGGNYTFKDLGLSIGGFAEYQNKIAHNTAVGVAIKYKELESFVRYRLALYDKKLNHNVDIYARYSKNFNFGKLNVKPIVGAYLTYSSKVTLDDKVLLKDRVGVDINLGTNISYEVLPKLNVYVEPNISGAYNNQVLASSLDKTTTHKISRSYFDYNVKLGTKYEIKGFTINPELKVNGDIKKNVQVGGSLSVGYNW
ncbi:pullulanase-associated domain-containing protein [Oceanivirga salmonicida]|uniref:pullulanase-associated domain-containing protein n=1 Tax=Oceanivirga salmonicida TaxID=1769291 RepID=UPI0012E0ED46|nr:pullulanase-associated domain-containing protein [Oceanivirga salmonicida]